jgi:response regulator of citrate/malate metabolism
MTADACRVLVVDDDFMVGRVHREFVSRMDGFVVVGEARSGAEAVDAARQLQPDIVLLDIYLPDMSGIEVLEKLRGREFPTIDVIVVTAARDAETVSGALRFGAVHYLIKPFSFEDLRERLKQVAETRRRLASGASAQRALAQEEVDRVFGAGAPAPVESRRGLPKGLSQPTMEMVLQGLQQQGDDESAAEFGDRVGLSRVSSRRYLEHLVAVGSVAVSLRYGVAGRPERRYRWVGDESGR